MRVFISSSRELLVGDFNAINMGSLSAKFQPSSHKTEGRDRTYSTNI